MKKDFTFNANDVTCNGIIAGCSTILTSESHAHLKTFLDTHFMMTDKNALLQELEDSNLIDGRWIVGSRASDTDQIIDRMVVLIAENPFPLPGVIDTLNYLSETDIKIGLATSSPQRLIDAVLKYLNMAHYFDAVHSAEFERYGKPHPDVYLKTADSLGVKPNKCLVIEDSLNGVISGKAAMMSVVCIPEKTHFPNPKLIVADYHFESMSDFLRDFRA